MVDTPNPIHTGDASRRIISIAVGEAHTLALTGLLSLTFRFHLSFYIANKSAIVGDGKVYSWGRGMFGRLGSGSEENRQFPVRVSFYGSDDEREDTHKIIGIAAGAYHSLALTDDGKVWGWGYNILLLHYYVDGQIDGSGKNYLTPHLLNGFSGSGSPDSSTQDDDNKRGKPLKITFSLISTGSPLPFSNFHGRTVIKVACGNEHVIALVTAGKDPICYSWGCNTHGQLGLGDNESRSSPEIIEKFNSDSHWEVYDMACGAAHTAVLAKRKSPNEILESFCWTFGSGENGQLGHGTTQGSDSPEMVKSLPSGVFLVSVGCGLFHTSVVSSTGKVWSWGMEKGLGLCPDARFSGTEAGDALLPLLVSSGFREPSRIACGGAHTVLVTDMGYRVWAWGRGMSGALGSGRNDDSYSPVPVLWPPPIGDDDYIGKGQNGNSGDLNGPEIDREKILESRLLVVESYASVLHGLIFGRPLEVDEIPIECGAFDIAKEWERMVDSLDERGLARLEMFYRDMRAGVKDRLLKRRVLEIVKERLNLNASSE
ncbi:regulator of chromosome condensation family protein [Striga asiatica]|uniref:Regulator of chromosome condensation family protein n=1 Tax=Striga asiatica TaxID=4170 RepID=A0A5A7NYZ6_STRAF|nr:regulator of chromosome condensation family protein [Striga asiatica]